MNRPASTRTDWTTGFALELQRLRPSLADEIVRAIAANEWSGSGGIPARDAARRYHGRHPLPRASWRRVAAV
jgi:hypothetical protein